MTDITAPLTPIPFHSDAHRALLRRFWTQHCRTCGREIVDPIVGQRFCSDACQNRHWRGIHHPPAASDCRAVIAAAKALKQERRAA